MVRRRLTYGGARGGNITLVYESCKGIIWKEDRKKKMEGQDIFDILTLFLGSTIILWVWKSFLNPNEIVASPKHGVKMRKSFLGIYVQIWCLRR